jgi:hypothetical protein
MKTENLNRQECFVTACRFSIIKSRNVWQDGLIDRMREKRNAYTILMDKPIRRYKFGGMSCGLNYKMMIDWWRTSWDGRRWVQETQKNIKMWASVLAVLKRLILLQ